MGIYLKFRYKECVGGGCRSVCTPNLGLVCVHGVEGRFVAEGYAQYIEVQVGQVWGLSRSLWAAGHHYIYIIFII